MHNNPQPDKNCRIVKQYWLSSPQVAQKEAEQAASESLGDVQPAFLPCGIHSWHSSDMMGFAEKIRGFAQKTLGDEEMERIENTLISHWDLRNLTAIMANCTVSRNTTHYLATIVECNLF